MPAGIPNSSPTAISAEPERVGGCEPRSVLSTTERADSGRTPRRRAVTRHAASPTPPRYAATRSRGGTCRRTVTRWPGPPSTTSSPPLASTSTTSASRRPGRRSARRTPCSSTSATRASAGVTAPFPARRTSPAGCSSSGPTRSRSTTSRTSSSTGAIVVYCAGGLRSALAADTLKTLGFTNVGHVEGGFGAWKEAGLPVDPVEQR